MIQLTQQLRPRQHLKLPLPQVRRHDAILNAAT